MERLFVKDIMENTISFKDFMEKYGELEYQKSFATNGTVKHPRRSNGLISTFDLFQDLTGVGEPVDDVDDFIDEYGEIEILQDQYDNTYNYNGYLDHYVNFSIYELANGQVFVTLAVGLGLDPRGGYTDNVALIFEGEYAFLEAFDETFDLMDFEITAGDKKYYGLFSATALSEFGWLSLTDQETGKNVYYDETILDCSDKDEICETVAEILEVNNIEISEINYFWEGNRQGLKNV